MKKRLIIFCLYLYMVGFISAQKMSIGFIYPAGGEKGTTVTIEIGGLNIQNATEVLISGDGINKAEIVPLKEKKENKKRTNKLKLNDQSSPQLEDRVNVQITIDKNATPGLRDLRLKSAGGISNKLPFEIGQYPNILEGSASSISQPNVVKTLPATLCGQIMPGEIDYYRFNATKGMQLVAATKGRTLVPYIADAVPGWFQPVIRIIDSKGKEVGFCDDYRNNVDPVIIARIPETDSYTLTIHDAIFRGREDFNYRIELGEIPFLEYAYPVVGKIGKKTKVNLVGVNLQQNSLTFKPSREGNNELRASGKINYISNPVTYWGVEKNCQLNTSPKEKTELNNGTILFDSVCSLHEINTYPIYALKNENVIVEVKARRLGSLMDPIIRLKDASGNILTEADDVEDAMQGLMTHHADPLIQFRTKKEGYYYVEVEDLTGNSGLDYFYMIERKENHPTFEVFVSPASLTLPKGGTSIFHLDIISKEKFIPELIFLVKGLPKGYTLSNLRSHAGSKSWDISVTAPEDAKEKQLSLEVIASAKLKGKNSGTILQPAVAADNMMQAFYYTHHIPAAAFVAGLTESAPFSLELSYSGEKHPEQSIMVYPSDSVIPIQLKLFRKEGFTEPVEISLNKKLKQLIFDPVNFLPGETLKTVYLKINTNEANVRRKFRTPLYFVGTVKGEIEKSGKRTFQNALYREYSPVFVLEMH
ncbi:MAG: hypothetical protein VB102_02940 [Paludibacter sp.]|nr:hypothetical protein [Paludibacter sp.]